MQFHERICLTCEQSKLLAVSESCKAAFLKKIKASVSFISGQVCFFFFLNVARLLCYWVWFWGAYASLRLLAVCDTSNAVCWFVGFGTVRPVFLTHDGVWAMKLRQFFSTSTGLCRDCMNFFSCNVLSLLQLFIWLPIAITLVLQPFSAALLVLLASC